jgi:hypothetical protein
VISHSFYKLPFARALLFKLALLYSAVLLFSMFFSRTLPSADFYINKLIPVCQYRFSLLY